jgi:hypothetical protein
MRSQPLERLIAIEPTNRFREHRGEIHNLEMSRERP